MKCTSLACQNCHDRHRNEVDKRQDLAGYGLDIGANILARIGTFLGNLAIIRLLGLDLTGQLGLIESWVGLITMFAVFGLNLAATKYVSQYLETDRERIGVITGTVLFWGALWLSVYVQQVTFCCSIYPVRVLRQIPFGQRCR